MITDNEKREITRMLELSLDIHRFEFSMQQHGHTDAGQVKHFELMKDELDGLKSKYTIVEASKEQSDAFVAILEHIELSNVFDQQWNDDGIVDCDRSTEFDILLDKCKAALIEDEPLPLNLVYELRDFVSSESVMDECSHDGDGRYDTWKSSEFEDLISKLS